MIVVFNEISNLSEEEKAIEIVILNQIETVITIPTRNFHEITNKSPIHGQNIRKMISRD